VGEGERGGERGEKEERERERNDDGLYNQAFRRP